VTTEFQHEQAFETIGLDITRKDMIVLRALLRAQQTPSEFVDFETIREQLALDEGSRKGKDPLIYRSLSTLEKDGFVRIDKSGHKHAYTSSIAIIEKALSKMISTKTMNIEKELKQIDTEVDFYTNINAARMATGIIDLAAGKKKVEKPDFAQGWENILKLLDDKIYKGIKKGDVIRYTLEWVSNHDYMNPKRLKGVAKVLEMGVEIRTLDHDRNERDVRESFRDVISNWRADGYKSGYRILPRRDSTYQFMGRNTEGIVLVVSESPLSATWIPRSSNPELVDNAIDGFDRDYEEGIDLFDFKG
jgi:hypothetical protein